MHPNDEILTSQQVAELFQITCRVTIIPMFGKLLLRDLDALQCTHILRTVRD